MKRILADVVLWKVEAEKQHPGLTKSYQVVGYPTFVMVNAEGATTDRWIGYTKDRLATRMEGALADRSTIEQKRARYTDTPDATDAATLGRYHATRGEYQEAVTYYRSAQELDDAADFSMEIFDAIFDGARKETGFTFEDTRAAADAVIASGRSSDADMLEMASMMSHAAQNAEQPGAMIPYIRTAYERTAGNEDDKVQARRRQIAPLYALYVEQDAAKAVNLKRESMDEGWMEDAGELNSFAWWCFEHKVNQREALELAEKGVELAEEGKQKAMILDTAAELCNEVDDCRRAVELIQLAIVEDPENEYYEKQLARFQERLVQMN